MKQSAYLINKYSGKFVNQECFVNKSIKFIKIFQINIMIDIQLESSNLVIVNNN